MSLRTRLKTRMDRILTAVSLERPDRVPVVLEYAGFAAAVTDTPMAEFISSPAKATATMIEAYRRIGGGDAINYGSFSPYRLSYLFGAKVKIPGKDLPSNGMWQVLETEIMQRDDYDRILKSDDWPAFFRKLLKERILNDAAVDLLPGRQEPVDVPGLWAREGVPVLDGGDVTTPFELICGARSMNHFFYDLLEIPDKVEAVMDLIVPHLVSHPCKGALAARYPIVWIGGWRTAPCLLAPKMWARFVWPYLSRLIHEVIDYGLIPLLHLDSNWGRELWRFKAFPSGKLIVALDGTTDIVKAKATLGGHSCLMGDVPAAMLAFDNPASVYAYCSKLIREVGPDGFILQSGCDIPTNAKLENVQAMVAAAKQR